MTSLAFCCELTLTHDVTQEGAPILASMHSYRVHICATEYRQLLTTCTYANLSWIKEYTPNISSLHIIFNLHKNFFEQLWRKKEKETVSTIPERVKKI